jgi:hypothetical protein
LLSSEEEKVIRKLLLWSAALLAAVVVSLSVPPEPASAATCADHPNQASAQRAKDTRDADGDGIYCEDLPCPCLKPGDENDPGPAPKPSDPPKKKRKRGPRVLSAQAVITHVVDGDTVEVETSVAGRSRGIRRRETIRLSGIDTPETVRPGHAGRVRRPGGEGPHAPNGVWRSGVGHRRRRAARRGWD